MQEVCVPVPFSPSLPDVSTAQAERAFRSESYVALFVRNVKPWAARATGSALLNYPFVLVVSRQNVGPIYFVALEESIIGTKCLGVFDGSGAHLNLGPDKSFDDERSFVRKALSLAEEKLGESFAEMMPQSETPARNRSWLGRLFGG